MLVFPTEVSSDVIIQTPKGTLFTTEDCVPHPSFIGH